MGTIKQTIIAAAALLGGGVAAANATTVTTTTTFTLDDSGFTAPYTPVMNHKGNPPKITDDLKSSYTITNTPITESLFTAAPNSSSGLTCANPGKAACDVVEGTIDLTLDLKVVETVKTTTTANNGHKSTVTTTTTLGTDVLNAIGTFYANYDGTYSGNPCTDPGTETDCVMWSNATNGVLTDYFKLSNGQYLEVILADAQDWDIMPKISFELANVGGGNQGSATPLPPALPLFIAGLGVLGLAGRRWRPRTNRTGHAIA